MMYLHVLYLFLFLFVRIAMGDEDIEMLKKEQEVLKKIVLKLKSANVNFEQDHARLKEDVNNLQEKVLDLETENQMLKAKIESLGVSDNTHDIPTANESTTTSRFGQHHGNEQRDMMSSESRNYKRGFAPTLPAFSACISGTIDKTIGLHHTFVYDKVYINQGSAYNRYTGAFNVPTTGTYAFLWTVAAEGRYDIDGAFGEVITELVVNASPRARLHADTETRAEDSQSTGFLILHLNRGDIVYVRSAVDVQGTLQRHYSQEWTFAGWQIA